MARDHIREYLGELIEELLVKEKEKEDMYLDKGTEIRLEADGVVELRFKRGGGTEYYSIRVTHHV